jgi:hypothetical protein
MMYRLVNVLRSGGGAAKYKNDTETFQVGGASHDEMID